MHICIANSVVKAWGTGDRRRAARWGAWGDIWNTVNHKKRGKAVRQSNDLQEKKVLIKWRISS